MRLRQDSLAADLVEHFWELWARREAEACFALLAADARYALYVPQDVLPFGGEVVGKPAVCDQLRTILDVFDTLRYEGRILRVEGDWVVGSVDFCFRHKVIGEDIDGTLRQGIRVRDGKIASWSELTDVARVRAFMRLVAWRASEM